MNYRRKEVKKIKTQEVVVLSNEGFLNREHLQKSLLANGWSKRKPSLKFKRRIEE